MASDLHPSPPSDVCLLLRAHAEQRWLSRELLPALRRLEQRDSMPPEELAAAREHLEMLWIEASGRAAESDAAYAELDAASALARGDGSLSGWARGYHTAVRTLRYAVARHVAQLRAEPSDALTHGHTSH